MNKLKRGICIIMAALIFITAPVVSYIKAQAVEILGGLAMTEILEGLLVSAGSASVGYVGIKEGQAMQERQEALVRVMLSDPQIAAALADAEALEKRVGNMLPDDLSYVSESGFKVMSGTSGKNISVVLDPSLITAAKKAVKKWADSEENEYKDAADADKAGTEKVDSPYMSSITTTVKTITAIDSMDDMDAAFGVNGACSYLKSQGYSDSAYYWLIHAYGSSTYFMPIPYGYSVVGYHLAWLGSSGPIILSNADYKNSIVQNGVRGSSSFSSYFGALPKYTGRYYCYDISSSSWSEKEGNYLPGGSRADGFGLSGWYTCNYKNAYSDGSMITWNNYFSSFDRTIYTYDSMAKYFTYDYSKAPSIPNEGYEFVIPSADYAGFADEDLASLVPYILSLSDTLKDLEEEQEKNQEELIQQGKDTVEAVNNMHTTVGKISSAINGISTAIGKVLTAVLSIVTALDSLPVSIADAFSLAFSSVKEKQEELVSLGEEAVAIFDNMNKNSNNMNKNSNNIFSTLVKILNAISAILDLLDAFDNTCTEVVIPEIKVPDIVIPEIKVPDIVIPEIKVPDIVIPEIRVPDIVIPDIIVPEITVPAVDVTLNPVFDLTLDPTYEITVRNDFTGLGDIIINAVAAVLSVCFIPDEALTMQKFGEIQGYFAFKDDIIGAFGDLKTMLFGIEPSSVLKIPIGKTTSKKYNYGTGNYIIIDISWYAPYKQFGDKIILAVAWAFFIWHIFIKLPGIISGAEGSVVSADRSYERYRNSGKE